MLFFVDLATALYQSCALNVDATMIIVIVSRLQKTNSLAEFAAVNTQPATKGVLNSKLLSTQFNLMLPINT